MFERNVKLLTWFNFFVDFKLYAPIAIIYFAQVTGSFALGMTIFGITSISAALFEVPTGIFSDYLGRKRTVILGATTAAFAVFCYALGFSYWTLIIGAIFEGLAVAFYSGNNDALLHETLSESGKEEEYHHYHGRLSGMFQVALGVSALIGGFLAFYSLSMVFWLSIIPQALCILLAFYLVEPKILNKESTNIYAHLKDSVKLFIKNPKLRLLSFASVWAYGIGESAWLFRSAFVNTIWPIWAIGIPQLLSNIGAAIGFFTAGKIISRFGASRVLLIGSFASNLINIISLVYVTIFSPVLMAITSPTFGTSTTAKSTLFQKEFTDKTRATMGSLNSFAGSLFFALVAYSIGLIGDRLDPAKALLIAQIFMCLNIFIYWRLFKHK